MDEVRLQRIARDVAALNTLALHRVRERVNAEQEEKPATTAARYGISLLTAQRIGRLPYDSLSRLGDMPLPLVYADTDEATRLMGMASSCVGQPPGLRPQFEGGTDPDLARVYLQVVREDAWRYDVTAAVRWSWPLHHVRALVELPVTALLDVAAAVTLKLSDGPMLRMYLNEMECSPMQPVRHEVRIGVLSSLGTIPVGSTA